MLSLTSCPSVSAGQSISLFECVGSMLEFVGLPSARLEFTWIVFPVRVCRQVARRSCSSVSAGQTRFVTGPLALHSSVSVFNAPPSSVSVFIAKGVELYVEVWRRQQELYEIGGILSWFAHVAYS